MMLKLHNNQLNALVITANMMPPAHEFPCKQEQGQSGPVQVTPSLISSISKTSKGEPVLYPFAWNPYGFPLEGMNQFQPPPLPLGYQCAMIPVCDPLGPPKEPQQLHWTPPTAQSERKKQSAEAAPQPKASEPPKKGPVVKRKPKKNYLNYYWSVEENRRYVDFLMRYPNIFDLPTNQKKNMRVNVMMSKRIKTRNPQQCHSHHQKMVKKYGSIHQITTVMAGELDMNFGEIAKLKEEVGFASGDSNVDPSFDPSL